MIVGRGQRRLQLVIYWSTEDETKGLDVREEWVEGCMRATYLTGMVCG